jgi:hypothetical protein
MNELVSHMMMFVVVDVVVVAVSKRYELSTVEIICSFLFVYK